MYESPMAKVIALIDPVALSNDLDRWETPIDPEEFLKCLFAGTVYKENQSC